jgi:hypothetical protein
VIDNGLAVVPETEMVKAIALVVLPFFVLLTATPAVPGVVISPAEMEAES